MLEATAGYEHELGDASGAPSSLMYLRGDTGLDDGPTVSRSGSALASACSPQVLGMHAEQVLPGGKTGLRRRPEHGKNCPFAAVWLRTRRAREPAMRNVGCILVTLGVAACAHRPPVAAPTAIYDCSDVAIVLRGDQIDVRDPGAGTDWPLEEAHLERRDREATLFTTRTIGDAYATEYVVPDDTRKDVLARVTDLHKAERLVRRDVCVARGAASHTLLTLRGRP